jgi:hypothetical protein
VGRVTNILTFGQLFEAQRCFLANSHDLGVAKFIAFVIMNLAIFIAFVIMNLVTFSYAA